MQKSNYGKDGGQGSKGNSAKSNGNDSTSKGIFEVLEETADAIGKNKDKLPQFTGENPAEWIITRRLCIEWISTLGCLEVIPPKLSNAKQRLQSEKPSESVMVERPDKTSLLKV
jgi:hypothetical protein